jgi:hypothetical protein
MKSARRCETDVNICGQVGRGGRGRGLLLVTMGAAEVRLWSVQKEQGADEKMPGTPRATGALPCHAMPMVLVRTC